MIGLDKDSLLGGGVPARETMSGKIGFKVEGALKSAVALDSDKLLVRDGQGRGAKIGPGKIGLMPEGTAKPAVALDSDKLLVRGDQAHGGKIGEVKVPNPRQQFSESGTEVA